MCIENTFKCIACEEEFHDDARGWDDMCVDCTADRDNAFLDMASKDNYDFTIVPANEVYNYSNF